MIDLRYSLFIEATKDPSCFGFYSPDLEGFTGVGHSIEDCLYEAKWGLTEHVALLREKRLSIPKPNPHPTIVIQNETRQRTTTKASSPRLKQRLLTNP